MSVDLSKLSSKELFELAKQREQEEHEASKRRDRLQETRKKREELIARHNETLAATEAAISELERERETLIAAFEARIAPLDEEINRLERRVSADEASAKQAKQAVSPTTTAAPQKTAEPPAALYKTAPTTQAPQPVTAPQQPPTPKPKADSGSSVDDLYNLIRSMLRNRTYISESLMKEKLKGAGYDLANFRNQIDQLLHEKRIDSKGRGNYALGKRK